MNRSNILKAVSVGAFGLYLYHNLKENPFYLGTGPEIKQKAANLIDKSSLPPMMRFMAKKVANDIISGNIHIKDVTPGAK